MQLTHFPASHRIGRTNISPLSWPLVVPTWAQLRLFDQTLVVIPHISTSGLVTMLELTTTVKIKQWIAFRVVLTSIRKTHFSDLLIDLGWRPSWPEWAMRKNLAALESYQLEKFHCHGSQALMRIAPPGSLADPTTAWWWCPIWASHSWKSVVSHSHPRNLISQPCSLNLQWMEPNSTNILLNRIDGILIIVS